MAETLLDVCELRAQAREHRAKALKTANPEQSRIRLSLALEYERLADAIEAEQRAPKSGGNELEITRVTGN